ncbi:MAG TPA: sigma-70 family RNA polymerase sigma factor [Vicinamibacterales bacterium]|jgi:RNA polymerase sigma-70 factor (ECF subfamily)|nr:sigma-70 family RNA polymerase sigma factor [Vicinamibacterales bacterium]
MAEEPGHSEPTDYDLLRRAAEGERQAFELVYRRYQQVVYRFARAMTGCPDAAEDITQEVFMALIKELPRYDPARAGFTTYLYGIARNLSRDQWRRTRRRLAFEALGLEKRRTSEDPHNLLERAQAAAHVHCALRGLPVRYREVIVLCDLHGLAYAEAAHVVRSSVSGVRARLHRARQLLRRRLGRLLEPAHARQEGPRPGLSYDPVVDEDGFIRRRL